mmetsp:Transcript_39564/g.51022  ORF Transcript_39564/g.51022 Transcript_39564/m.51022 type:complete len:166 (+) Transcript_39564:755-1252(+)
MKFGQFPFIKVKCYFDYSTYSQYADEILIITDDSSSTSTSTSTNSISGDLKMISNELIDISTYMDNYEVGEYKIKQYTKTNLWLDNDSNKQHLNGFLEFEHQPSAFYESVLIPDLLLHLAIFSSMWISRNAAPARVAICIISGLTFRVLMSSVYAEIPKVPYSLW